MDAPSLQPLIDQRLDSMEQALIGLLPRQERHELVAQIAERLKALHASGTLNRLDLPLPIRDSQHASLSPATLTPARSRLSTLALLSGLLGIGALVLMFATPVIYLAAAFLGEAVGEIGAIAALGSHVFLIAIGGFAAVIIGFTSLLRLSRQSERIHGRGWAITALCTGCIPMVLGGMLALMVSVSFIFSASVPAVANAAVTPANAVAGSVTPAPIYGEGPAGCRMVEWQATPTIMPPPLLPTAPVTMPSPMAHPAGASPPSADSPQVLPDSPTPILPNLELPPAIPVVAPAGEQPAAAEAITPQD